MGRSASVMVLKWVHLMASLKAFQLVVQLVPLRVFEKVLQSARQMDLELLHQTVFELVHQKGRQLALLRAYMSALQKAYPMVCLLVHQKV